jgi:Mlc titration factor MtfA (ptsG expression regulator)
MLHEGANGCPPLHADMSALTWRDVFSQHYAAFCLQIASGQETAIDPYAAENPAEFFAVLSEVFFDAPLTLQQHLPAIYEQLALFYRQDPVRRWMNT